MHAHLCLKKARTYSSRAYSVGMDYVHVISLGGFEGLF